MIKYRPAKSKLDEAMEQERSFDMIDTMFDYIVKDRKDFRSDLFSKEDLSIEEESSKDQRINLERMQKSICKVDWKRCVHNATVRWIL